MLVYRIENKNKIGPYQGDSGYNWFTTNHTDDPINHPSPPDDIGLKHLLSDLPYQPCRYKFGFKNVKQLKSWFTKEERRNLFRLGFKIVKIKISMDKVIIGDKQVLFLEERK